MRGRRNERKSLQHPPLIPAQAGIQSCTILESGSGRPRETGERELHLPAHSRASGKDRLLSPTMHTIPHHSLKYVRGHHMPAFAVFGDPNQTTSSGTSTVSGSVIPPGLF